MRAWLAYFSMVLIWGSVYFAVVLSFESFTPFATLAIRFLVAALVSIAIGLARRESWPEKSEWRVLAIIGLVMLGGGNMLTTWAVQSIPTGLVAVLMSLTPLWIVILSLRRELPRLRVWFGLGLGIAGVWLLIGPGAIEIRSVPALVAMGLAPFIWAFGTLYAQKLLATNSVFTRLGIELGFAALVSLAGLPFLGGVLIAPVTPSSIGAVIFLSLCGSLLAYAAYFYLLQVWSARRVGTFAYLTPLVAVALGTIILREPLSLRALIGMATALAAVSLTGTGHRQGGAKR